MNALNADLHCHSTASDGTLSPAEVVRRAHANGVDLLALTDHDELLGISDAAVLSRPEPLFPRLCSAGNPANKKTAGRKICPRRFGNGYSAMSNLSGVTSAKLWS